MKKIYALAILSVLVTSVMAQSSFMPPSWSYSASTDIYTQNDGLTLYKHKLSSPHFDVYYGTGYGTTSPDSLASSNSLYVDVPDLLKKAEIFFDLNVNKLKFADLSVKSNLNNYKMIIVLLHDTGWTATGSGYDNKIGALWVTPSTCHPIGQTIAHEIGHAFQYQVYADLGGYTGFRQPVGNGSSFWEQTAQWQSVNAYPDLMISQSIDIWKNSHNYAFTHEWQRYQSYWLHYYWAEKYGIDAIGKIWRGGTVSGEDPCQVYMRVFGVSVNDFYKEIYDYASKMVTYDLDSIRRYGKSSIGQYTYNFVDTLGKIQVAYSSVPQSTGFNVIPLEIPKAGTKIRTIFTALPSRNLILNSNDPSKYLNGSSVYANAGVTKYNTTSDWNKRGFRHGYVALLEDGTRVYQSVDSVYAKGRGNESVNDTTTFVVPSKTKNLWFVVSPAPTGYIVHKWDESVTNDDQWPYQLEFNNTDVIGHIPTIDLSDENILPYDTLIEVNVGFNASTTTYPGTTYALTSSQMKAIGNALRVQPADISSLMKTYSASQTNNSIMFLPLNPTTNAIVNTASTANGYGHWFNSVGSVCSYGASAFVYSELNASTLTFTIGQFPGKCENGEVYKLGQAFRYKNANGKIGNAKIIFHIYIGGIPEINIPEDVNDDDVVDSQDILKIYDYIQTSADVPTSNTKEDVNKDSRVDSQDVLKVYDYVQNN